MRPRSQTLQVIDVVAQTDRAISVTLAPTSERAEEFGFEPGQFLTLAVPTGQGRPLARCYSIANAAPSEGEPLRLTFAVKRVPGGAASNWLCDNLAPGMELRSLPPAGRFTPTDWARDLVLLAAGSGITPIMSILRTGMQHHAMNVDLLYANRSRADVIFDAELCDLQRRHHDRFRRRTWFDDAQGPPTATAIAETIPPGAGRQAFVCGPTPFMDAALAALASRGYEAEHVHHEKFLSLNGDPFADAAVTSETTADGVAVTVELDGRTHHLQGWGGGRTLLDFLEEKGLEPPYSCREGECSACAVQLVHGDVSLRRNDILDEDELARGMRLACQTVPPAEDVSLRFP